MESTDVIFQFATRLVDEQGFGTLDPGVRTEIEADVATQIQEAINLAVIGELKEGQLDAYGELLDGDDLHATQLFLKEQIPNLNELVAATMMRFRTAYLSH